MNRSETIGEIAKALAKFQGEVKNPKRTNKNDYYNSSYAPLDEVINTGKLPLSKYGLSYVQSPKHEDGYVSLTTLLMHESGEWLESEPLRLPAWKDKKNGDKELNAQTVGIGVTYGRRYQLESMLGLSSEEDDDGNGISVDQDQGSRQGISQGRQQYDQQRQQKKQEQSGKDASTAQLGYLNRLVNDLAKKEGTSRDAVLTELAKGKQKINLNRVSQDEEMKIEVIAVGEASRAINYLNGRVKGSIEAPKEPVNTK
ncbi:ERF family protein [Fictibacillus sp. NRS-1165]|uniref:ERF family protein n=1 Tax=Fictibacillus sp. NRS-1165 TaxID=3144463 RepID=UPI003D19B7CE